MQYDNLSREELLAELGELRRQADESEAQEARLRRWMELVERVNALKENLLARGSLNEKVKRITDGLVKIFGADFARIWITRPGDRCDSDCVHAKATVGPHVCHQRNRCLHLMASSGRYTHIDGELHRRVPFDCYKIGRIASGAEARFLTNDVANDPRIHDQNWARELGLVSFAGYRLLSEDSEPIGVMALFAKQFISLAEQVLLEGLANTTSQVVHSVVVDEALQRSHGELDTRFKEKTKDLREVKEQLDHILSSNPAVIYSAKPGGDFATTFISDNITAQLGYEPREFLEDPSFWPSHIHTDDVQGVLERLSPLFEEGHHVHEYRFRHKDGSYRWMRDELKLIRDEKGTPVEIVGFWVDITDHKQEEQNLRIRDNAIKTSINAIHFADPDGTTIFANDSFLKMWGFQGIDDAVGLHISELSDDREEFLRVFAEFQEKGSYEGEITARRRDGTFFEAQISASSVLDDSGKPVCIMASFLDVTDRKQAEKALRKAHVELELRIQERTAELKAINVDLLREIAERNAAEQALRESEERYRGLVENSNDIVFQINPKGLFTFVNRPACRISGYSEEELVGRHFTDLIPPGYREETARFYGRQLVKKIPSTYYEFPFNTKNGEVKWVGQNVLSIMREDEIVGLQAITRDITERRKSEEALRKSEEFNRRLVEHAPFGIAYLSGDGTIEYVNPAANAMMGIPEGRVSPALGGNILELPGLKDRSEVEDCFHRLLKGESLSGLEVAYKSSAGIDTELLVAATPRVDLDGTVAGAILMFTDISERKRAEKLQRETARFRAVADLAGGVAHNFNNLLQAVMGNLELALLDLELGNYLHVKHALEKALKSSRFGADTVRRLQSFAGIRDRTRVPERGVFDLSGIVRQALEMTKTWWKSIPEREGRKVSLDIHLKDGCLVQGEKNDLFEVAVNLIKNATEALPQEGTIDVETRVEGDQVILKVRDTGIGISQENLKRLFNPFFTTKASAGSGLGLASSRKIIEDCGGEILVESKEGHGTTFTALLPLVKEEPEPPKTEKTPAIGQQLTVLVIDDEAILDQLKNVLTRHNCKVFTALSGEKGLDIFKGTPVELVICDLGMPGMNGWAVGTGIRAICQERRIKKTPFILLTGWGGQKTEAEKIAESGVDAVVEKPLNIKNMLEVLREVVEKGRSSDV